MGMHTEKAKPTTWLRTAFIGRHPERTLRRVAVLVVAGLVVFVVFSCLLLPIRVEGISMLPTYRNRQFNLVNRLSYCRHEPQRGDVVAIRTTGFHIMYLKRIIGLPGERVAFHRGHVTINGQVLSEPYLKFACDWELPPEVLGPDEYFLVGDNRSMPPGEHFMFKASRARIVGKVLF